MQYFLFPLHPCLLAIKLFFTLNHKLLESILPAFFHIYTLSAQWRIWVVLKTCVPEPQPSPTVLKMEFRVPSAGYLSLWVNRNDQLFPESFLNLRLGTLTLYLLVVSFHRWKYKIHYEQILNFNIQSQSVSFIY